MLVINKVTTIRRKNKELSFGRNNKEGPPLSFVTSDPRRLQLRSGLYSVINVEIPKVNFYIVI